MLETFEVIPGLTLVPGEDHLRFQGTLKVCEGFLSGFMKGCNKALRQQGFRALVIVVVWV